MHSFHLCSANVLQMRCFCRDYLLHLTLSVRRVTVDVRICRQKWVPALKGLLVVVDPGNKVKGAN